MFWIPKWLAKSKEREPASPLISTLCPEDEASRRYVLESGRPEHVIVVEEEATEGGYSVVARHVRRSRAL